MVKCEICGLELKTTQALAGYKQFKHELAGRYAKAYELAESVELLGKKKAEQQQNESNQNEERIRAEADLAQIRRQIAELGKAKAEKQAELMQLQQLGQVKANEVVQVLRQQLVQAGWYPLGQMNASSLGFTA